MVLVARRGDVLDGAGRRAGDSRRHRADVEVLAADLADADGRARVADGCRSDDAPIDLLVNNAGLGAAGPFVEGDLDRYRQIEAVNIEALVELSHAAARARCAPGAAAGCSTSRRSAATPRARASPCTRRPRRS